MITFEQAQPYIFAGESGGDYNALFNYQNRKDGLFSDIKLTEMTLDEVLDFTNPRGAYANYVGLNNKGTISTPVGAYQVVGRTLRQAKEDLNLSGDEKFSKSLQDKIGRYIFNTQGVDAWEGYKGPRGQEEIKSMAVPNNQTMNTSAGTATPLLQNMMQGKPRGIMDFLRDPRTRMALASLSRGQIGQNQLALAQADMGRMQTRQLTNKTVQYLRSQEGGAPYADAIALGGADPKQTLNDFMTSTGRTGGTNIQSSVELPNLAGFLITTRSGDVYVQTRDNRRLTDPDEIDEYIKKAQQGEIDYQKNINAGRESGKLGERLEFAQRIKEAETFGAKKIEWIDEARNQQLNIESTVGLYKQALVLLDQGASTGRIAKLLPTTSAQTALLETVKGQLGLDVIGSVTFGALSEGELNLAMDLGLPSDKLSPSELRKWLTDRIDAKSKAAQALQDTAAYLSLPNTTVQSYYRDYLNINPPSGNTPTQNNTTTKPVNPENPLKLDFGNE